MEVLSSYLTLSSRSLHSILAFPPPFNSRARNCKMTTYARPSPPPINTLPVELLSYIFVLSAHTPDPRASEEDTQREPEEGSDDISPCLSSSVSTTPDVLASVNRHWRGVALNTPQLWTRICVTIGDIIYCREGPMFSVVSRYLSRSGKSPLDVFVDARDPEWDFSETE